MNTFANAFLYINMGVEMAYILDQRLKAQSVDNAKSIRVLGDVVVALFKRAVLEDMLHKQCIMTTMKAKIIFTTLAHCSIMKLNENSMDKLFDLMLMGMKHQVMTCPYPGHMLCVTNKHLETIRRMTDDAEAVAAIDYCSDLVHSRMMSLSETDLWDAYFSCCNFLQDKKVKVVMFLEKGWQRADASFVVMTTMLPPGGDQPLTITYNSPKSPVSVTDGRQYVPYNAVIENEQCFGYNIYHTTPQAQAPAPLQATVTRPAAAPIRTAELDLLMHFVSTSDNEHVSLFIDDVETVPLPDIIRSKHVVPGSATVATNSACVVLCECYR